MANFGFTSLTPKWTPSQQPISSQQPFCSSFFPALDPQTSPWCIGNFFVYCAYRQKKLCVGNRVLKRDLISKFFEFSIQRFDCYASRPKRFSHSSLLIIWLAWESPPPGCRAIAGQCQKSRLSEQSPAHVIDSIVIVCMLYVQKPKSKKSLEKPRRPKKGESGCEDEQM